MKVVLTRGSGPLADAVIPRLLAGGHDVRVPPRPDGLAERRRLPVGVRPMDDGAADAVLALSPDVASLRRLAAPGVRIVVVTDRDVDEVEGVLATSGAAWTLQATTVLHDDLERALRSAAAVPHDAAVQPIDAGEVADRVVRLLRAVPACRVPDAGGPAVRTLGDLAPHVPDGPVPADWPADWFVPRRVVATVDFDAWCHGSAAPGDAVEGSDETVRTDAFSRLTGAVEQR